jgi:hypothetical protein
MYWLTLEAEPTSVNEPKRIICKDNNGVKIATVFVDGFVKITSSELSGDTFDQIQTVKNNFHLFWNNLQKS